MYFTSGAKVRTMRLRSWGSFVSRSCLHRASVSSWEMRFRLLGSSFIGSSGSFGRGGSRLDRPAGAGPLAGLDDLHPGFFAPLASSPHTDPNSEERRGRRALSWISYLYDTKSRTAG